MIFLTVGTTSFAFDRLLRAVDQAMGRGEGKEKLVAQKGVSSYRFAYPHAFVYGELPFNSMLICLKKARVVISSGGPATTFLALQNCQTKPLVVPRRRGFREHVDDHELFFTRFLAKQKMIITPGSSKNLAKTIGDYLANPHAQERNPLEKPKKLITNLKQYCRW